jgi:hypothetical protein
MSDFIGLSPIVTRLKRYLTKFMLQREQVCVIEISHGSREGSVINRIYGIRNSVYLSPNWSFILERRYLKMLPIGSIDSNGAL